MTIETTESNELEKILAAIKDADEKFATSPIEPLVIDPIKVELPTQSEMLEQAQNETALNRIEGENDISNKYDSKISSKKEDIEEATATKANKIQTTTQKFDQEQTSNRNNLVKNGLAFSSILQNSQKNIDAEKNATLDSIKSEFDVRLATLNEQKLLFETQKENAMKAFDIKQAIILDEKLQEITAEVRKQVDAANEYNSTIEKRQDEYLQNILDSKAGKEILANFEESRVTTKIDAVLNVLGNMSNSQILQYLDEHQEIAAAMGDTYLPLIASIVNR